MTSLRGPGERNFNAVSHKPTRAPIQSVFESWRLLGVMRAPFLAINKWEDLSLGSLHNAAIAKKRNSLAALLNALTAFGEERCRQSKRKLDVLVH